jgi:hypothetical protein
MPDTLIVPTFLSLLQAFSTCFTSPSFDSFVTLMTGWTLDLRRHTVTEVVRAAGAVGHKHVSSYHRFFSRARWTTDAVGLKLARGVIERLAARGVIRLVVDDTLGRHTGKCIAAASMHRDPLLSTGRRPFFHWGHVWVVLAVEVTLFDKSWALPVLFRLHRSEKRCRKEKRPYRKLTEEARELVELLCKAYPDRRFELVGDAAYTNGTLIKKRCDNLTVIGRGRLDAALYAPPPKRKKGQMGRSRVRGQRLPSPEQQARKKNAPWKKATVIVYGKSTTVRVLVIDALWYVASGGELMRLVVVRGFPGHERDDVFVSTDENISPGYVVETYAKRWSLEVTFHEAKGKLGFGTPAIAPSGLSNAPPHSLS